MPAKTILTLLFLSSLCVVVFLGLHALPRRANGDPTTAKKEILVATSMLPPGTLLRAKDVAWQPTANWAAPGQILRPASAAGAPSPQLDQEGRAEVYGAALRHRVSAGEPINRSALVKPGDRDFLQVVLSPRARAIAIPVTVGGASTGLLYPGDWVDVILTQTFKNDPPLTRRSVGETVVENLRVLAIDPLEPKPTGPSSSFGRTVTLEVSPEQAEKIDVATELGKLSLTLRSLDGTDGNIGVATAAPPSDAVIKPIWAGDVSPALGDALSSNKGHRCRAAHRGGHPRGQKCQGQAPVMLMTGCLPRSGDISQRTDLIADIAGQ
jgi:pilus assembly protein CpaB